MRALLEVAARTDMGGWKWSHLPAAWVLVLIGLGLFFIFRALYRRERGRAGRGARLGLALIRALVLFLIVLALSAPYREEVRIAEERSHLVILVDASGSMLTQDRYPSEEEARIRAAAWPDGQVAPPSPLKVSRLDLLQRVLAPEGDAMLEALDKRFVLHTFAFASDWWTLGATHGEEPIPTGERTATGGTNPATDPVRDMGDAIRALDPNQVGQGGTNLGAVLRNVAGEYLGREDRRLAGVLLLTDGRDTGTDESPLDVVVSLGAARTDLHITPIGLGNDASGRNIRVERIRALDVVLVGDDVVYETALRHRGFEGQSDVRAILEIVQIADGDGNAVPEKAYPIDGKAGLEAGPFTLGNEDESIPVRLQARMSEPGTYVVRVRVELPPEAAKDDAVQDDNVAEHQIRVVDERIKVLVVDNKSRRDFLFLGNWLTREPGESYVGGRRRYNAQLLQLNADPSVEQGHSPGEVPLRRMPANRRDLFAYDVIVLGDVDWHDLAESTQEARDILELIRDFVREGGGLALVAGIDYHDPLSYVDTPLQDLLPITPRKSDENASRDTQTKFGLELTDIGRIHPIFGVVPGTEGPIATPEEVADTWAGGSSYSRNWVWYWLYHATRGLKPGAFPLAVARPLSANAEAFKDENGRPLVVFSAMSYGKGRVFFSASDGIWRLRYGLGDTIYGPFWDQIIRYLATYRLLGGNKRYKISTDKETYYVGDAATVTITALNRDFEPMDDPFLRGVHITHPDGRDVVLEGDQSPLNAVPEGALPGTYRTTLPIRRTGTWRVWISDRAGADEGRAEHRFEAVEETPEKQLTRPDHDLLAELAKQTDGRLIDQKVAGIDQLADIVRDLPDRTARRVIDRAERPQWDKAWVLLLIVGLLALEWMLRKRWQMI